MDMRGSVKGFTLVEILVSVAIIGILVAIVFYSLNPKGAINRSDNAVIASNMDKIAAAARTGHSTSIASKFPDSGDPPSIRNDQYILAQTGLVADVGSGWPTDADDNAIVYTSDGDSFCISARIYPLSTTSYFKITQIDANIVEDTSPCTAL